VRSNARGWTAVIALLALVVVLAAVLVWLLATDILEPDFEPAEPGPFEVVMVIEGPETGDRPLFDRPLSAAFGPDGRIYVADTGNARVCVFTAGGRFVSEIGTDSSADQTSGATLVQPAGIAVAPNREIHVADVSAGSVFVFDAGGDLVRSIAPDAGTLPAGTWAPTDVAVVGESVYVTDETGIAVFAADGTPAGRLRDTSGDVALSRPNGIAAGPDDTVLVSDTNARRVVAIGLDGTLAWVLGPESGQSPFGLPRGLTATDDGTVIVADAFKFGIALVSAEGDYIETIGSRGAQPGQFEYPNDVDARGDLLLVTDKDNDRVQVLRLSGDGDDGGHSGDSGGG